MLLVCVPGERAIKEAFAAVMKNTRITSGTLQFNIVISKLCECPWSMPCDAAVTKSPSAPQATFSLFYKLPTLSFHWSICHSYVLTPFNSSLLHSVPIPFSTLG